MSDAHGVVRIAIANDHQIVRDGLRHLLETQPDFVVVGEAGDGDELIDVVRRSRPDVLLLDLAMPKRSGLDVLPDVTRAAWC